MALIELCEDIFIAGEVPPGGDFAVATTDVASLVYLCQPEEGCLTDQDRESSSHNVFEKFRSQVLIRGDEGKYKNGLVLDADGRPRLDLPLAPGLFEVSSALKAVDEMDRMPMPMLFMSKSSNRAGAMASVFQGCRSGWSAQQTLDWAESLGLRFFTESATVEWVSACVDSRLPKSGLLFRQLFESNSSTFTYILGDAETKEAIIIDSLDLTAERDAETVFQMGLKPTLLLSTHVHPDYFPCVTGKLKRMLPGTKSALSEASEGHADVRFCDGDKFRFGTRYVEARVTPGHTTGDATYVLDDRSACFTGDTLLIRGCGRTDYQGGSSKMMYSSIMNKIFTLPNDCKVYPAHDNKGRHNSTVGEEKMYNPCLTKPAEEFVSFMDGQNVPKPPGLIDEPIPANMVCGIRIEGRLTTTPEG